MPTVADVEPLQEILHSIKPGAPLVHGALTVIPLLTPSSKEVDWVTLEEAGDDVVVTEAAGGASVPTLEVSNAGDRPLLLLDGEELIGAKQNRVLNTTVLVGAHSMVTIPVSCVEAGRWAYRTARFAAGGTSLYASLRADKAAQVTDSLRLRGRHQSDQAYIWKSLAARERQLDTQTPMGAMHDVFERHDPTIAGAREALGAQPRQIGSLVYLSGRWVGLDVLGSEGLFRRVWPRLSVGYAADAIGREGSEPPRDAPGAILEKVPSSPVTRMPAVGLGWEARLDGGFVRGAALIAEERVVHLMAFPTAV